MNNSKEDFSNTTLFNRKLGSAFEGNNGNNISKDSLNENLKVKLQSSRAESMPFRMGLTYNKLGIRRK